MELGPVEPVVPRASRYSSVADCVGLDFVQGLVCSCRRTNWGGQALGVVESVLKEVDLACAGLCWR